MASHIGSSRGTAAILSALASILVLACGGDDGDGGGGGTDAGNGSGSGNVTCTLTATAVASTAQSTVTGTGSVACTGGTATVEIETCVQWNASGSFEDIQCMSGTQSGVSQHAVQNVASCGITPGRMFRTRANAKINGSALTEQLSTEIGCD